MADRPLNILCISRFFKGEDFIRSAKEGGNNVYLLTSKQLDKSPWPWESIDEAFYMVEDEFGNWNHDTLIAGLSYKMRSIKFDFFTALDDFDVEHVAFLREYYRIPGMGETTVRYFRDKLAMRMKAEDDGVPVPAFTSLFNDADISEFAKKVKAPWLVKPRMQASAAGLKKIHNEQELWDFLKYLGDERHEYLVEKFTPGNVYHVDSLSTGGKVVFASCSQYIDTPLEVAHEGGIFRSMTLDENSSDYKELLKVNEMIMKSFGMQHSASHSEFIKSNADGKFYFLETSSRVGGANLAEMVEYGTGINLWREWAKVEIAESTQKKYKLPKLKKYYAGIVVSLSRFENPDTSEFDDKEIVWRMQKPYHIGLIVRSESQERIRKLLDIYADRIKADYHASLPAREKLVGETPLHHNLKNDQGIKE